jgi:glycosyltransferase involved in cell wall biosynthesis
MKCFVLGTARNCERYIVDVFKNIDQIVSLFDDFRIIVAYDCSIDGTLDALYEQSKSNRFKDRMKVFVNQQKMSKKRTKNIARARNCVLEEALKQRNSDAEWEYFIMMDLDDVCCGKMNLNVLKYHLMNPYQWDSLSFNRHFYYDIWALSYSPYTVSCWNFGPTKSPQLVSRMRDDITEKLHMLDDNELFDCESAFNGFAIYKFDKFMTSRYDHHPSQYVSVEDMMFLISEHFRSDPLTSDCEHRSFHHSAKVREGARIRISPMILFEEIDDYYVYI